MMFTVTLLLLTILAWGSATASCHSQEPLCPYLDTTFPKTPPVRPCYGGHLCTCSDTTADCSSTFGKLTFVPELNRSYLYLNFSNNKVSEISDLNFFHNVSREVRAIDLYNNGLRVIKEGVFRGLHKLETLLLGGSNLLGQTRLSWLSTLPGLINISLGCSNAMSRLSLRVFESLHNVRQLDLSRNDIFELDTAPMLHLEGLNLDTNRLFTFPRTCSDSNTSVFPSLESMTLDTNMIGCIEDPVCLPELTQLKLRYNRFKRFTTNMFWNARFPKLKVLKIMQMENKIRKVEAYFINNTELRNVVFLFNNVDFSTRLAHADAFGGCTSVEQLGLSGNSFKDVTVSKFQRLLRPMERSLRILFLSRTHLRQVSSDMFSRLGNLTTLYLFQNSLFSIPDGVFDGLNNLQALELDNNNIVTISETTFSSTLRNKLRKLTLGYNAFRCSCNILWFQQWLNSNRTLFSDYKGRTYRCANLHETTIEGFALNTQACMLGSDAGAFTIAVSCVLLFFLLLFTILFRFRWHMRLWLYQLCRGGRRGRRRRRGKYDVFVSYAEEDARWVLTELLPVTEGQWGLTLCLHQRDFRPGKHIVDNIADCVNDSERVLLVLSPHFSRSEWCQFELKFCQSVVMERDDVMVLVALRETRSRDMTGAMLAVLRTTTYIEWEEGQDARQAFWGRLRLALEDPEEAHLV